jgi:hypothetical protein
MYVVVGVVLAFLLLQNVELRSVHSQVDGPQYQYLELVFTAPVFFNSSVADGYYRNGNFESSVNENATVLGIMNAHGSNGWRIISISDDRTIFYLEREIQ